jgi:magnesium chelatase family protein
VLEVLRQPLEQGTVSIARAARTAVFPARFILVGAMNPCPCGYAGDSRRECRCTPQQIDRYRSRLSGPLRDRMDLTVEVPAVSPDMLDATAMGEPSSVVRARVVAARERQRDRCGPNGPYANAAMSPSLVMRHARPDAEGRKLLSVAVQRFALSARGYDRVKKVARTIADLAGDESVSADHVGEALQFRMIA